MNNLLGKTMWTVTRLSADSDVSIIDRWAESFDSFEEALRYVVSVLDQETAEIVSDIRICLTEEGFTLDEAQDLYFRSESIVMERETEIYRSCAERLCFRAFVRIEDASEISVTWLPE